MFDPAHYWGPCLGLQGPPAAGGPRQTSISDYGRLHNICSYTQILVPCSFDQNAAALAGCIFTSLKLPSKTRWGAVVTMYNSLIDGKESVQELSDQRMAYEKGQGLCASEAISPIA